MLPLWTAQQKCFTVAAVCDFWNEKLDLPYVGFTVRRSAWSQNIIKKKGALRCFLMQLQIYDLVIMESTAQ